MKYYKITSFLYTLILLLSSCQNETHPNHEMIELLQSIDKYEDNPENSFSPEAILRSSDSLLNTSLAKDDVMKFKYRKANALIQLGQEQKAVGVFQELLNET